MAQSDQPAHNVTRLLYWVLLGGQLIFLAFALMMLRGRAHWANPDFSGDVLYWLLPVFTLGAIVAAFWAGARRDERLNSIQNPEARSNFARETVLLKCAMVEGANLYAIIIAVVSLSYLPLVFLALGLLAFAFFYPRG
jgi:hypothetical protein